MAEVVDLSTSRMNDDDIKAIAVYLKDVSGPAPEAAASPDKNVLAAGKAIYQDLCSSCHTSDGKGVPNMFPNLRRPQPFRQRTRHGSARDPARRSKRRDGSRADRSGNAGFRLAA